MAETYVDIPIKTASMKRAQANDFREAVGQPGAPPETLPEFAPTPAPVPETERERREREVRETLGQRGTRFQTVTEEGLIPSTPVRPDLGSIYGSAGISDVSRQFGPPMTFAESIGTFEEGKPWKPRPGGLAKAAYFPAQLLFGGLDVFGETVTEAVQGEMPTLFTEGFEASLKKFEDRPIKQQILIGILTDPFIVGKGVQLLARGGRAAFSGGNRARTAEELRQEIFRISEPNTPTDVLNEAVSVMMEQAEKRALWQAKPSIAGEILEATGIPAAAGRATARTLEALSPEKAYAREMPKLPSDLVRAAPRYRDSEVAFANDIDKALYIIAQPKKSRRDADYLAFVMDATGLDEVAARAAGRELRLSMKDVYAQTPAGETMQVPFSNPGMIAREATPEQAAARRAAAEDDVVPDLGDDVAAAPVAQGIEYAEGVPQGVGRSVFIDDIFGDTPLRVIDDSDPENVLLETPDGIQGFKLTDIDPEVPGPAAAPSPAAAAPTPAAARAVAGDDLERRVEDLADLLDPDNKSTSLGRLVRAMDKLPEDTVDGLEIVREAVDEYKGIQRKGLTPEEYVDEKANAWEAVEEALGGLTVLERELVEEVVEEVAPDADSLAAAVSRFQPSPEEIARVQEIQIGPSTRVGAAREAGESADDLAALTGRGGGAGAGRPPRGPEAPGGPDGSAAAGDAAEQAVEASISRGVAESTLFEQVKNGWSPFKRLVMDDLNPIEEFARLAEKLKGLGRGELAAELDPYIAARMSKGSAGKGEVAIDHGTFGKEYWEKGADGKMSFKKTGASLSEVLEPVKGPDLWFPFVKYVTARRAVELSARNIKTGIKPADASMAVRHLESKHPMFVKVAEELYAFQDRILDYGEEMGIFSPELLEKLRAANANYVPFQRLIEATQIRTGFSSRLADIANPLRRIKGSERVIVNPLEGVIKNTYAIINAAERNQVGVLMAGLVDQVPELSDVFKRIPTPTGKVATITARKMLQGIKGIQKDEIDEVIDLLGEGQADATIDIFRASMWSKEENVLTIMRNGKKEFYQVDPEIYKSMMNLNRGDFGFLLKFFGTPAKTLRAGAVLNPDFMLRNPMRDQMSAFMFSRYNFIPGYNTMQGAAQMIGKTDEYLLYKMSGAEFASQVATDREFLQKSFNQVIEDQGFIERWVHPVGALQRISSATEVVTRMGEFSAGIRAGATPLEAGFAARDLMDYNKMGTTARALNQIIPFFNASIRGTDKLFSEFRSHPIRTLFKTFVGVTLPSLLLYYVNRDNPRYQELPEWQKNLFWIVIPPGENSPIIRIPKPFEPGILFGSLPERMWEKFDRGDEVSMTEALKQAGDVMAPGYMPQAMLPLLENATNHSFFMSGPVVSPAREKYPRELQYGTYTSDTMKVIGSWANYSPAKLENLYNGWTAGLGGYALFAMDELLQGTGIAPQGPSITLPDAPVVKAFVARDPYGSGSNSVSLFYDKMSKMEEVENKAQEFYKLSQRDPRYIPRLRRVVTDNPEAFLAYDYRTQDYYSQIARSYRRVARTLSDMRSAQEAVMQDRAMSAREKKDRIRQSNRQITYIAQQVMGTGDYAPGAAEKPPMPRTGGPGAPGKPRTQPTGTQQVAPRRSTPPRQQPSQSFPVSESFRQLVGPR